MKKRLLEIAADPERESPALVAAGALNWQGHLPLNCRDDGKPKRRSFSAHGNPNQFSPG
jgi:hypothetical protein